MQTKDVQRYIDLAIDANPRERVESLALMICDELDLHLVPWLWDRRVELMSTFLSSARLQPTGRS